MSREDLLRAARREAATMLLLYHRELSRTLDELVESLPSYPGHGRAPYRLVMRHFLIRMKPLIRAWRRTTTTPTKRGPGPSGPPLSPRSQP